MDTPDSKMRTGNISSSTPCEHRKLIPSLRTAPCLAELGSITIETRCPSKYAVVDLETGELWSHDGTQFKRMSEAEASDVAYVARLSADGHSTHPDNAVVDRFAAALKGKLARGREKGRGGWDDRTQCSDEHLAQLLVGHLQKDNPGNFLDVAAFAMMLHERGAQAGVLSAAAAAPLRRICSTLAALRDRYDETELRPRIAELVSEIETGKC